MQTSESIKQIATALTGFHKEVGKIRKDASNPFFKKNYASLSGILEAIREPLINNGLSITQFPEGENNLTTRLLHTSGEYMEATYQMKPVKDTPQDRGSAITYQRRYAVGAILSLQIDEDDDGNNASGKTEYRQDGKLVKNGKTYDDAVKSAIKGLDGCAMVSQLKEYKATLDPTIVKHPEFVKAATNRFNNIMQPSES